jgi:uncharacterized protein YaaN involved in tellurite resistance
MSENNNTQSQSITLTLSPEEAENQVAEQQAALEAAKTEQAVKDQYDESKLTEQERRTVNEFSKKIDIMETNTILQYGSAAQKKVTDFSDSALKNVRTQDLGEVGDLLSNLVTELKTTDQKEEKGI